MKVLIDTNVILDVLMEREPHVTSSAAVLNLCGTQIIGMFSACQTSDIYYLLRRNQKSANEAKSILRKMINNIEVIDVLSIDVKNALDSEMVDYEDALIAYSAKRRKVDYIITRNEKDFTNSPVSALTPDEFLNIN